MPRRYFRRRHLGYKSSTFWSSLTVQVSSLQYRGRRCCLSVTSMKLANHNAAFKSLPLHTRKSSIVYFGCRITVISCRNHYSRQSLKECSAVQSREVVERVSRPEILIQSNGFTKCIVLHCLLLYTLLPKTCFKILQF